ncbi:hypothetical protein CW745_08725 [Psychromonas sp. psych-6C06]|uniref:phosphotransferase enzyme family protein n=1 Tax=Psychromonas sp. psych-6C06 TaxID=2058089 RepID=UPI000C325BAA|nr:phosphotransferase [Psychromonas sp. psych-6C06]PKF61411.1 hypothetical protein CW745_08725 [Psychromonas sp. psych-6C06]
MLTLPVSYSASCPAALLQSIIPKFQIDAVLHCLFWCQGLNDSYKVSTEEHTFILRVYRHNWRSREEIQFEIDALLHLQNNGVNVAAPILTYQNDYIVSFDAPEGLRHAILINYIPGDELDFSQAENARKYAEHMAHLHLKSAQFNSSHKRFQLDVEHLIEQPLQRIKPYLADRKKDWLFIESYAQVLSEKLSKTLNSSTDIGLCHGDLHGGNAHFDGNLLASFDFDCCAIGLRVYDLAVFKWSLQLRKQVDIAWKPFLQHYQTHRSLSNSDLKIIDTLVSIRHIWLIGLHIDIAVAKGWLSEKYFDHKIEFLRNQYKNEQLC